MKNPLILTIFIFIICLISVGLIIFLEKYIGGMFFAVIIEGFVVFLAVWFLLKITNEKYFAVIFLFTFFFIILETGIYALCGILGFIEGISLRDLISWRMLYSSIFTFIWIPLTCRGLKYKDKMLWILFWILGFCLHLGGNMIFQVVS